MTDSEQSGSHPRTNCPPAWYPTQPAPAEILLSTVWGAVFYPGLVLLVDNVLVPKHGQRRGPVWIQDGFAELDDQGRCVIPLTHCEESALFRISIALVAAPFTLPRRSHLGLSGIGADFEASPTLTTTSTNLHNSIPAMSTDLQQMKADFVICFDESLEEVSQL
ncbi:hypothetical protein K504DRAFT_506866 [Pleomassaria siparia CBS 279.74]|uniref:Uncharacterized protein n=1 Tax=Pleomassaria siparia CBS 279.74 TaxID=1314801 RepID=A0A6G1JVV3_9PLEO|nr:hypothetical protein K504DRAFT_506866 [Pleomassaria siparia CBS 279.74]